MPIFRSISKSKLIMRKWSEQVWCHQILMLYSKHSSISLHVCTVSKYWLPRRAHAKSSANPHILYHCIFRIVFLKGTWSHNRHQCMRALHSFLCWIANAVIGFGARSPSIEEIMIRHGQLQKCNTNGFAKHPHLRYPFCIFVQNPQIKHAASDMKLHAQPNTVNVKIL